MGSSTLSAISIPHFANVEICRMFLGALVKNIMPFLSLPDNKIRLSLRIQEAFDATTKPFWHCFCHAFDEDSLRWIQIIYKGGSLKEPEDLKGFVSVVIQLVRITKYSITVEPEANDSECILLVAEFLHGVHFAYNHHYMGRLGVHVRRFHLTFLERLPPKVANVVTTLSCPTKCFNILEAIDCFVFILKLRNLKSLKLWIDVSGEPSALQKEVLYQAFKNTKIEKMIFRTNSSYLEGRGAQKTGLWDCLFRALQEPGGCSLQELYIYSDFRGCLDGVLERFAQCLPGMKQLQAFHTYNEMNKDLCASLQEGVSKNKSLNKIRIHETNGVSSMMPYIHRNRLYHQAKKFSTARQSSDFMPGTVALAIFKLGQVDVASDRGATARYTLLKDFFEYRPALPAKN